jgi:hypothetical protein
MKLRFAFASLFVLASAGGASAAMNVDYTFANSVGAPFCDGVKLNETGLVTGTASGIHTGTCVSGDYAGGVLVHIPATTNKIWVISSTDATNAPGVVYVYVLDQKALTWTGYAEQTGTLTFQQVRHGMLLVGTPPAGKGQDTSMMASKN